MSALPVSSSSEMLHIGDFDRPSITTHYTARQIVVRPGDDESFDRMVIVQASGVLNFWNDREEDVYPVEDGTGL